MVYPSWISPIDINVTKPRLEEQNSLVPICKGLLASIIVIRYEEHDQDGGSMINVYHIHLYLKRAHWTQYSATSEHATTWNIGFLQYRWESKGTGTTELDQRSLYNNLKPAKDIVQEPFCGKNISKSSFSQSMLEVFNAGWCLRFV